MERLPHNDKSEKLGVFSFFLILTLIFIPLATQKSTHPPQETDNHGFLQISSVTDFFSALRFKTMTLPGKKFNKIAIASPQAPPAPPPQTVPQPAVKPESQQPVKLTPAPITSSNPFRGEKFFIDPTSSARQWVTQYKSKNPQDALLMEKVASHPWATWFGSWNTDVKKSVTSAVNAISAAHSLPVLVAYNIPQLDCNISAGARSASAYKTWIKNFADGIGSKKAIVLLEPDALGGIDCLSTAKQEERFSLISYAVWVLKAKGNIFVYIDAGNPTWASQEAMAERLKKSGIANAQGFALNISNFFTTEDNITYGKKLSSLVEGKHFIIDTSRNGKGPAQDLQWCNPKDRGLGEKPTANTADPLVDAYYWIKTPGESDGTCNGGPTAGKFWPVYALTLAKNASW